MGIVFVGFGYVARWTAQRAPFATLAGTSRSQEGADRLTADGAAGLVFDGQEVSARLREVLSGASHVLISTPPDAEGCPSFRALHPILRASANLRWTGYLSTTGVYGDRNGGWCFEWEAPTPSNDRARRRIMAERQWLDGDVAAHVFRLPGIYGPGRSMFDRIRADSARRVNKPGLVFNRIHVADIAAALALSMEKPSPGLIANVVDDRPAPPQDVVVEAYRLLGQPATPEVPFEQAGMTGMAAEFYRDSKRCSNALLKARLGWRPVFPTYKEGLADCFQAEPAVS